MSPHPSWDLVRLPDNEFGASYAPHLASVVAGAWWPWLALVVGVLAIALGGLAFTP